MNFNLSINPLSYCLVFVFMLASRFVGTNSDSVAEVVNPGLLFRDQRPRLQPNPVAEVVDLVRLGLFVPLWQLS